MRVLAWKLISGFCRGLGFYLQMSCMVLELVNGMVEWWNGGMVEWWNGGRKTGKFNGKGVGIEDGDG